MTRQEAKKNAEVMAAYVEGKKIEILCDDGQWGETDFPSFDFLHEKYRVKKEETYRPFRNEQECFNEMKKHGPFGWVVYICDMESYYIIKAIEDGFLKLEDYSLSLADALKKLRFADGTPFGIKE